MSKAHFGWLVAFPLCAGAIFCLVSTFYVTEIQTALQFGGFGTLMAFLFGFSGLPSGPEIQPSSPGKLRGIERKLDYIRRSWKSSPLGFLLWHSTGTFVGAIMLGGLLFAGVDHALGVPDPLKQPVFSRASSGPYDLVVYILSGVLFFWVVFIPLCDWIERLDAPKSAETDF